MEGVYALPSWPPSTPWEAYIFALLIPFILRFWLLRRPLLDLISVFAPKEERTRHWRWLKKNHQRLPITGFDGLLKQEVIAFILPTIAAGIFRLGMGEVGWENWESIPDLGEKLLIIAFIYWVLWDFRRVMRTRRSIKKMAKMNLERVKRRVERVLAGRDFLRNIEEFRIPRPWSSIEISDPIEGEEMPLDKPSKIKSAGVLILNKAADLIDYGLGYAKTPAEGLAEQIETRMQAILDNHMQATRDSMFSNVMFSLFPLIVLKVLPEIV
jgi:hypothetical protein